MPWTVPWSSKKKPRHQDKYGKEQVTRARKMREKVTSNAVRGRRGRSRSKSASSTRRKHVVGEIPLNHPCHGTVKSKLTTAMLSRSLRRRKDDPYIN